MYRRDLDDAGPNGEDGIKQVVAVVEKAPPVRQRSNYTQEDLEIEGKSDA